jgi:hypothetical protein
MSHHPVSVGKLKKNTELKRNNAQELRSKIKLLITIFCRFPSQNYWRIEKETAFVCAMNNQVRVPSF